MNQRTTRLFWLVLLSLIDCFSIGFSIWGHRSIAAARSTSQLYEQQQQQAEEDETSSSILAASRRDPLVGFSEDKEIKKYDPSEKLPMGKSDKLNVGDPQLVLEREDMTVTDILRELAAIRQEGPQKYCILGTRHCSFLHQQIIELLAYALVLSGNHVFTSGAQGTNAAAVRGALRAEQQDLITVVLPQSLEKQTAESQELLAKVDDIIAFPQHDEIPLDEASKLCNSFLLNQTDQLISFAFHESNTVIEAAEEAKELKKLVTMLFLD